MDDEAFDTNAFSSSAWEFFGTVLAFVRSLARTTWVGPDPRGLPVDPTPLTELMAEDRNATVLPETRGYRIAKDDRNVTVTA